MKPASPLEFLISHIRQIQKYQDDLVGYSDLGLILSICMT